MQLLLFSVLFPPQYWICICIDNRRHSNLSFDFFFLKLIGIFHLKSLVYSSCRFCRSCKFNSLSLNAKFAQGLPKFQHSIKTKLWPTFLWVQTKIPTAQVVQVLNPFKTWISKDQLRNYVKFVYTSQTL